MRTRGERNRRRLRGGGLLAGLLAAAAFVVVTGERPARAGGPLAVGGTFGPDGQPFTWSTASEIQYRPDRGKLGKWNGATARAEVAAMFQVWEDVPTATIGFTQGPLIGSSRSDNVDTVSEFNALSCTDNAIVFDEDGSLFTALGFGSSVIGFAGPCAFNSLGRIVGGRAALNGKFIDGAPPSSSNPELTDDEFRAAFIHEFGHFSGLDHSQINLNCLTSFCSVDEQQGLPTMFPILVGDFMKSLATDDIAWISRLYPSGSFNSNFGTLSGTIFFSDGVTHAQGVNVIARQVDNGGTPEDESSRIAVSVVSGYLFTGNPGQNLTGTNPGDTLGSRNSTLMGTFDIPVPPGTYTIEVESINSTFDDGSSVGPLDPPLPNPGADEFWDLGESPTDVTTASDSVSVSAGGTVTDINIILNGTPPRFDQFESARLWLRESLLPWVRHHLSTAYRVLG